MFRTYAQLVRLPNVFTALADICLGTFVALTVATLPNHTSTLTNSLSRHLEQMKLTFEVFAGCWPAFIVLLLASACLYSAGMVWNDYFDVEQDRRDRPFRPIPSGRVSPRMALSLGLALICLGLLFAGLGGRSGRLKLTNDSLDALRAAEVPDSVLVKLKKTEDRVFASRKQLAGELTKVLQKDEVERWQNTILNNATRAESGWTPVPLILAGLLVLSIFAYDAGLKRTWAGPLGMGMCRLLNVLLGVCILPGALEPWSIHLALVVGIYITGVTWFARTEAQPSNRRALAGAAAVMLMGIALGLLLPAYPAFPAGSGSILFPYLLVSLGFTIGIALVRAIRSPGPVEVQQAVKRSIMGLVALDAILACGLIGELGLAILVLLLPAVYLGRWIYST